MLFVSFDYIEENITHDLILLDFGLVKSYAMRQIIDRVAVVLVTRRKYILTQETV